MAGGRAVPLSDGCAHCLEPRRCLPSSEGREFVGCFACFSFSNRVKEDLIFEALLFSFPSLSGKRSFARRRVLCRTSWGNGRLVAPKQPRAPQLRVILC